jgi:Ca2+-binding RTX toxin-like protein
VLDGGTGNDTMIGGAGDDTYVVNAAGDVVTEASGEGTDTVQSTITYTLSAEVENLVLTGTGAINATGNALDNTLTGNSGNNIENLILTGTGNINGTGNTLDNALTGNAGTNVLDGGAGNDTLAGGAGNDTLIGGAGDDLFIYLKGYGSDSVNGGVGWTDTIQFDQSAGSLEFGSDWTINLTQGSIVSQSANELVLSNDADGVISISDGSQISATDIERIHW